VGAVGQVSTPSVYLDTNAFIYWLEGSPTYADQLRSLFGCLEGGKIQATTSELALAELLVKPIAEGNAAMEHACEEFLTSRRNLALVPVSRQVLLRAARIRALERVRLPDAIHVATALLSGCEVFLTNDRQLLQVSAVHVCLLSDWSPPCA